MGIILEASVRREFREDIANPLLDLQTDLTHWIVNVECYIKGTLDEYTQLVWINGSLSK